MFEHGIVREVKKLSKKRLSRTAQAAIGIREVGEFCAGRSSEEEARERMKQNTRNYARRQLTWFRKDKRVQWVSLSGQESAATVCVKLLKGLK
jgi:tRNA dimethylallyltransferase